MSRPSAPGGDVRPLAVGYLRVQAADPPETAAALTAGMGAYADREGLMLAEVYTDLLDPPAGHPDRAGFCALMDALRRDDVYAVVIPTADHLSRRPIGYTERRTILETEVGVHLHVIHPSLELPQRFGRGHDADPTAERRPLAMVGNTRSLPDGESTDREMPDAQDRLAESFSDHPELALRAPVIGDAFGRILARCWTAGCVPGEAFEVVERDDGLVTVSDAARYFGGPETWPSTERWACESALGRVLDVGCGAGRHALALSARGHDVIGLEPSAGAVEVARGRGVCTVPGSIDNPPVGLGQFDTLLLAGSNLGLLESRQAAQSVLGALAAMASPGAQILGCGIDPYQTSDSDHLAYHAWNRERDRYPGQVRLRVRDGRLATEFFNYLFLSADELSGLVEDSPWQLTAYDTDGANCLARLILR